MTLVVLNSSVDVPDYMLYDNPDAERNTRLNEMESIAELVVECAMDMRDEFPESKNDDSNSNANTKKAFQFKYVVDLYTLPTLNLASSIFLTSTEPVSRSMNFIREITPPPPKV